MSQTSIAYTNGYDPEHPDQYLDDESSNVGKTSKPQKYSPDEKEKP